MRRKPSAKVASVGVAHAKLAIEEELGWLFREQPTEDYGIDAHAEVVDEETVMWPYTGTMDLMDTELTSREYELLTQHLMRLIAARSPLMTTRLEHDVSLTGRSAANQIDVVWEFETAEGAPRRVIIECRRFRTQLKMKDLHAWRSIVDDLNSPELPTIGVMATLTGYQSGAKTVADTYGVVILRLREPTEADLKDRLTKIRLVVTARLPIILPNVHMEATEEIGEIPNGPIEVSNYGLLLADGRSMPLMDYLLSGHIRGHGEPAVPLEEVLRIFDPPAILTLHGTPRLKIRSVTATVGEQVMDVSEVSIGGRERLAYLIANVLDSTAVWFIDTEDYYVSDNNAATGLRGSLLATDVVLGRPSGAAGNRQPPG